MGMTNAERQARWRAKRNALAKQALRQQQASPPLRNSRDDAKGQQIARLRQELAAAKAAKDQRIAKLEARLQEAKAAGAIAMTVNELRERLVTIALPLPREERIKEIDRLIDALELNVRDWVTWFSLGRKERPAAKAQAAKKAPLPPDEARDRQIKSLKTEN